MKSHNSHVRTWTIQSPKSIKKEQVTSGYWHFKPKGLSSGLPRWGALQSPFDLEKYSFSTVNEVTALVNTLGSFLSSPVFLVLCRLKIIKWFSVMFFLLVVPLVSWPQGRCQTHGGVSSKVAAYLGFLKQQPGRKGRIGTAVCARIGWHGVNCEPEDEVQQWCTSSSQSAGSSNGCECSRMCTTHEHCGVYPCVTAGISQHWILLKIAQN